MKKVDKSAVINKRNSIREQLKAQLNLGQKKHENKTITKVSQEADQENENKKFRKSNLKTSDFASRYLLLEDEILGEGAHAIVKVCESLSNQQRYAVKITRSGDPEIMISTCNAFKLQKSLNHNYVIKAHELFLNEETERIYFVMELCSFDSLRSILQREKIIQEDMVRIIIRQLLQALDHIHMMGVCHRDLKPENILFSEKETKLKIIDFGISTQFKFKNSLNKRKNQIKEMLTKTGTLQYMAPEMLTYSSYNQSVDMWSVGIITYELLCGQLPFYSEYILETQDLIQNCQLNFDVKVPKKWLEKNKKDTTQTPIQKQNKLETILEQLEQEKETPTIVNQENKNNLLQINDVLKKHVMSLQEPSEQEEDKYKYINIWSNISDLAKDFIQRLIKSEKRLSVEDSLLHPWIKASSNNQKLLMSTNLEFLKVQNNQKEIQQQLYMLKSDYHQNNANLQKNSTSNHNQQPQPDLTKSYLMGKQDIYEIKKAEPQNQNFFKFNFALNAFGCNNSKLEQSKIDNTSVISELVKSGRSDENIALFDTNGNNSQKSTNGFGMPPINLMDLVFPNISKGVSEDILQEDFSQNSPLKTMQQVITGNDIIAGNQQQQIQNFCEPPVIKLQFQYQQAASSNAKNLAQNIEQTNQVNQIDQFKKGVGLKSFKKQMFAKFQNNFVIDDAQKQQQQDTQQ